MERGAGAVAAEHKAINSDGANGSGSAVGEQHVLPYWTGAGRISGDKVFVVWRSGANGRFGDLAIKH